MDLFIYSDESGVFDYRHQKHFVFGGLILLGSKEKAVACRRYRAVERDIRANRLDADMEIKACNSSPKIKGNLYRSLNPFEKFGVVMNLQRLNPSIFCNKRSKQRYMDYAYKIGLKNALKQLIEEGKIKPQEIKNIHVYCDEHSTATNGLYEMREALLCEFKYGTFNQTYEKFFEPLFPHIHGVEVQFCCSKATTLIRPADIVANHIYTRARRGEFFDESARKLRVKYLP